MTAQTIHHASRAYWRLRQTQEGAPIPPAEVSGIRGLALYLATVHATTAHAVSLATLDYLNTLRRDRQPSEDELRGVSGFADYLVLLEEVDAQRHAPDHADLVSTTGGSDD